MAGRALRMGELTLCITPSGDGVIPHPARSGAQAPQLAKKVLTMRGRGLGEERGREALRATQACCVSGLSCEVSAELLLLTESGAAIVAAVPLPGRAAVLCRLSGRPSFAALTGPAPTAWHVAPRLPAHHSEHAPFL